MQWARRCCRDYHGHTASQLQEDKCTTKVSMSMGPSIILSTSVQARIGPQMACRGQGMQGERRGRAPDRTFLGESSTCQKIRLRYRHLAGDRWVCSGPQGSNNDCTAEKAPDLLKMFKAAVKLTSKVIIHQKGLLACNGLQEMHDDVFDPMSVLPTCSLWFVVNMSERLSCTALSKLLLNSNLLLDLMAYCRAAD